MVNEVTSVGPTAGVIAVSASLSSEMRIWADVDWLRTVIEKVETPLAWPRYTTPVTDSRFCVWMVTSACARLMVPLSE